MREANIGYYLLTYNLIVSILLMLASEKIGHFAGLPFGRYGKTAARYTSLSVFTFGATVAVLMGSLVVVFVTVNYLAN